MKKKVEIAIIDNGVTIDDITKNQVIVKEDSVHEAEMKNENNWNLASHGTKCVLVVAKHCSSADISSVKILDEDGIGIVNKIEPALKWCFQKHVRLVNLSFGTTHFLDKAGIRKVINYYANKGMIIVAASANNSFKSYPAAFSNVIGVIAGETFTVDTNLQMQKGVDFIAPSNHDIVIKGYAFKLEKSNSYAAPFVTAMIGTMLMEETCNDVCKVRKKLLSYVSEEVFFCYPDWIDSAWVSEHCDCSEAEYYFKEIKGNLESCIPKIDTIVVKTMEEFTAYSNSEKHVVYLGKKVIEPFAMDKYFWSREKQKNRILSSKKRVSDIDIPIIISKMNEKYDVILLLSVLRSCFSKDGYNVYTISNKAECILYDLEFLPEELCDKNYKEQIHNFLYWQTYYNQNDAILFGTKNKFDLVSIREAADMVIELSNLNGTIETKVYCNGKLEMELILECLSRKTIGKLYQKILKFFAEDLND